MSSIAVCVMLGLVACSGDNAAQNRTPSPELAGWRLISGKAPTRAEFAAVVAACEGKAVMRAQGQPLDACLGDLGLKRVP